MEVYVKNSLNYTKAVKFNISLRYFVIKGEKGEHFWTLDVGTTHSGTGGVEMSRKIHNVSVEDLDEAIEQALSELSSYIDWTPTVLDKESPYVHEFSPIGNDVSIGSQVLVTLKEDLPSAGMDLSNMRVTFDNGAQEFDITSEVDITGDPYVYKLKWLPERRVYDTYD
jgi:hypothetical protein